MEAEELKQRARAVWSSGDYDAVARHIWNVGADLVGRVGVRGDDTVLDVACGTGNATIPAAETGARVTGLDLTPELLEIAGERAAQSGLEIEFVEGDAENLPFADESFDVVVSTFGCMFAPRHEVAAAEIARVLRPGGRIGIAAWNPEGSIGDFFRSMSELAPPPPPGLQPPILWGTREHVARLFDGTGVEPRFEDASVEFRFDSLEAAVEEYYERFGPIVMLRAVLEPEGRGEEIKQALHDVYARWSDGADGPIVYPGAYLVTLGEKAGPAA